MHHQPLLLLNVFLEAGWPGHAVSIYQVWSCHDSIFELLFEPSVAFALSVHLCLLSPSSLFTCDDGAQFAATGAVLCFTCMKSIADDPDILLVGGAIASCRNFTWPLLLLNVVLEAGWPDLAARIHQVWGCHDSICELLFEPCVALALALALSIARPVFLFAFFPQAASSLVMTVPNSLPLVLPCASLA